jgi:hypothetical protein
MAVVGQPILDATLADAPPATRDEQGIAFHLGTLGQPLFPLLDQNRGQRHHSLFLPFASHPQSSPSFRTAGRNEIRYAQGSHFSRSQPRPVHQAKHEPITRVVDVRKEPLHIGLTDVAGQGSSLFHPLSLPDNRVGPGVVIRLVSQKLEKVV